MWPVYNRSICGLGAGQVNHVLLAGQSLAIGMGAYPAISTTPRGRHWMFMLNQQDDNNFTLAEDLTQLRSLVEQNSSDGICGETPGFGFSCAVSNQVPSHSLLVSNWSRTTSPYSSLSRTPAYPAQATGSASYLRGLAQVAAARRRLGLRHKVQALLMLHGESDFNSATYATDIRQWQLDVETDYLTMCGEAALSRRIPMFHSQASSWTQVTFTTTALSPALTLLEHKTNPTKTTLVCPKYFFNYFTDGIHLTALSHRLIGEYYAKAYVQQVLQGTQWNPLYPSSVVRTANVIDVTFTGNVGQLVLDTTLVSNPGNYGFEYTDDTAPPAISRVDITGVNTVRVTLASTPSGANKKLRYAYTGTIGQNAGPTTGPRGCLRDSETRLSMFTGQPLYNWCVHFDEAAT